MLFLLTKMLFLSLELVWNPTHPTLPSSYDFQGNFSPLSQAVLNFRHLKTFMAMGTDCKITTTMPICLINNCTLGKERRLGWSRELHHSSTPHDWTREVPWVWIWKRCWNEEAQDDQSGGKQASGTARSPASCEVGTKPERSRDYAVRQSETPKPQEAARVTGTGKWWETHDSGRPRSQSNSSMETYLYQYFCQPTPPLLHFS